MAEAFIEEIYKYSRLVGELQRGTREARRFRKDRVKDIFTGIYQELCECCSECLREGFVWAKELSENVVKMSDFANDYRMLADHVDMNVLPLLKKCASDYADIDLDTGDGYRLCSSAMGYLTAQICDSGKYIHSTYDPMEEAEIYIENMYEPSFSEYIFWGCGMGYYIYQLYRVSFGSVKITVYEKDENLVDYARHYGVLDWVPDSVLNIIFTEDTKPFIEHCNKSGVKSLVHFAEIDMLDNSEKALITPICIGLNTSGMVKDLASINVYRNLSAGIPDVDAMQESIQSDAVVVAAGPSLDESLDLLRKWKGQKTIIAVNTVFRKLLQNGIRPDFVVVLDSSFLMQKHLEGLENETVPIIVDLCVYWRWIHDYKGPKYMVYSTYTCQEAEDYIKLNGKEKWPSGGTVTFLAMEFAIRKHAKRIFFIGVDMGYPNGNSHASGTAFEQKMDHSELIETEQVGGGRIQTDYVMNLFRESLEQRIRQVGDTVSFFNLSTCGARIKGTTELDPKQFLMQPEGF